MHMELSEVERLQRQVDGLKLKLRDFKLLKTRYTLKTVECSARKATWYEDGTKIGRLEKALTAIADSDELVTAARLRRYAAKVLGR